MSEKTEQAEIEGLQKFTFELTRDQTDALIEKFFFNRGHQDSPLSKIVEVICASLPHILPAIMVYLDQRKNEKIGVDALIQQVKNIAESEKGPKN